MARRFANSNGCWAKRRCRARAAPPLHVTRAKGSSGSLASDRAITAQIGQMLLFFLTILLSGMLLSQLIEEKSNKIIEVIAAAVPIDALFIGKLFAMLAASVVGIVVWVGAGAAAIEWLKPGGLATLPPPAVGWPVFLAFAVVYFAMNYLLLGAVFLTIGAQASTVREVQTLSMPVTFVQVLIFGFAAPAIGAAQFGAGDRRRAFPFVVADGDARPRRRAARPVAACARHRLADPVGRPDPARRRAAVPQDRAQIRAAHPMVAALREGLG